MTDNRYLYFISLLLLSVNVFAFVYETGPGMTYENIGDVPLESLVPGDTVLIHYRDDPYCEKWVIARSGTPSENIVFLGVPGPGGELPVIDGRNAVTRLELDYWSEGRGVINLGGSSIPDQEPDYVVIENLEIRSGRSPFTFTDDNGEPGSYSDNASSIYVVAGEHITIRNCVLHDCGNGFFSSHESADITIEYCHIYDNGIEGSIYHHNNYTESQGIIFQYNHFGPLRNGCAGNNLKDRSCGTIIRYNWIDSGNRQLDLVDSSYPDIYNDPSYPETFVYGNILIEQYNEGNGQICHYGGDGSNPDYYRKGILYFYSNTVISSRSGNTTLFRLSTNAENADARNNIVYVADSGERLALLDTYGILNIRNNWFKTGWVETHQSGFQGTVINAGGMVTGELPGFYSPGSEDFHLVWDSQCVNAGTVLHPDVLPDHDVQAQYVKHCQHETRPYDGIFDIGAFEYQSTGIGGDEFESGTAHTLNVYRDGEYIVFCGLGAESAIKLFDVTGRLLHSSGVTWGEEYRWNTNGFPDGVYMFLLDAAETIQGKFILMR